MAVVLPVISASWEFVKNEIDKNILMKLYDNVTNDRLRNIAMLSIASTRAESISLENFVDEFDSRHDNSRIKSHWITDRPSVLWSPSHLTEWKTE